jgi:putative transposase
VKYAFIQEKLAETNNPHRLGVFCRMLEVSRSGFYEWVDRGSQPNPDTIALEVAARAAHVRGRESYGPKRLRAELTGMGAPRSSASVKRLRKRWGLRCRHRRHFVRTTDGDHALPIAPNLLEQRFNETTAPNQVWVTDITYVHTDEGWLRPAGRKFAPVLPQSKICLIKRSLARR